jgi:8-oxo-dGTP pyrophosphatase MutT (NUDIX family)
MSRECRIGHLTSSALVMDEHRSRVLLTLHPKVGRWLQLGGHNEQGDASISAAARREAQEESGIDDVVISRVPLRLDRHPVPCGGAMSEHLDVQYLALVPADAQEVISDESDDLRWFPVGALPEPLDPSVRALIDTALAPIDTALEPIDTALAPIDTALAPIDTALSQGHTGAHDRDDQGLHGG